MEIVGTVLGGEGVEDDPDAPPERVDSACRLGPECGLELRETHLDRVHVWRVWRQVEQLRLFLGKGLGVNIGGKASHDVGVKTSQLRMI